MKSTTRSAPFYPSTIRADGEFVTMLRGAIERISQGKPVTRDHVLAGLAATRIATLAQDDPQLDAALNDRIDRDNGLRVLARAMTTDPIGPLPSHPESEAFRGMFGIERAEAARVVSIDIAARSDDLTLTFGPA